MLTSRTSRDRGRTRAGTWIGTFTVAALAAFTLTAAPARASTAPPAPPSLPALAAAPSDGRALWCGYYSGTAPVSRGDSGNEVREVQCLLRRCGYDVPVDGLFGAGLEAVVKRFQRDHGLAPDGTVGPGTWQALRKCGTTAAA
ncbi:peptidoglycan-binding domain-containing protein [Streptomyces tricolor]|uniref:peptidoglycan-binding domain-containing protein n=1 Tax=Streptomyces tricolor TaxID=68277 RepID=UPI003D708167